MFASDHRSLSFILVLNRSDLYSKLSYSRNDQSCMYFSIYYNLEAYDNTNYMVVQSKALRTEQVRTETNYAKLFSTSALSSPTSRLAN